MLSHLVIHSTGIDFVGGLMSIGMGLGLGGTPIRVEGKLCQEK